MDIKDSELTALQTQSAKDFCKRVYATSDEIYEKRLKAIGINGKDRVLDAGCGFGQWAFMMAKLNKNVDAFDFSDERVITCKNIHASHFSHLDNLQFNQGTIEKIDSEDNVYDAIFCYSTIFFADYKIALNEFYRVLKPGGMLYFCANDIGWYMYNLVNDHNPSSDFSSQQMSADAIEASILFYADNKTSPGKQVIIPVDRACGTMEGIGFKNIKWDGEGLLNFHDIAGIKPFYAKEFMGRVNVYEITGVK